MGYYQFGDMVKQMGGFVETVGDLRSIFDGFSDAVTSLGKMEIGVTVNKPVDVNVRLLNDNILKVIDEKIMSATLDAVAQEIPKWKNTEGGGSARSESTLPS